MVAQGRAWLPSAGDVVMGRYRVESVLGRGGMAVVLAARDERLARGVAIKILEIEGDTNTERFLRESKVGSKIDSEHVAELYEVGAFAGKPCLVMERLHGTDFGARVRRGPLPLVEVADCIVQTCEALAIAHGAGIVHRDIKASNLFEHVRPDGSKIVKVLDFGISKFLDPYGEERTLTRTAEGTFLGSPPYMSPEQFRNPRTVDGRADLWSLGVVAFRLLSTRFPFAGESSVEVFAAILETEPERLRDIGVIVPAPIEDAIARCLRRSREDRFANAAELAQAFAPYASARWRTLASRIAEIVEQRPGSLMESRPEFTSGPRRVGKDPHTMTVSPPEPSGPPGPPPALVDPITVPQPPSWHPAEPRTVAIPQGSVPSFTPAASSIETTFSRRSRAPVIGGVLAALLVVGVAGIVASRVGKTPSSPSSPSAALETSPPPPAVTATMQTEASSPIAPAVVVEPPAPTTSTSRTRRWPMRPKPSATATHSKTGLHDNPYE